MKTITLFFISYFFLVLNIYAQNSMVGDGFGGRKWYKPYNYTVGSYSAYTICGEGKQLYAWGSNQTAQLGNGTNNSTTTPVQVSGMDKLKYYSTGYVMSAIKDDNSGWIWGYSNLSPVKVIDDVKFVDAGINNSVFVKNDGTVWSVGENKFGEFGDGMNSEIFSNTPKKMLNINNAVRTAQGEASTTVLLKDGSIYICGFFVGNLFLTPEKIIINAKIVDIKANAIENIALDDLGNVWHWNGNTTPYMLPSLKNIVAISGCNDGFHFLLLDENHDCYALGDNSTGQCGISSTSYISAPIKVASNVNDIMAGEWFSYIVKTDGKLYATGMSNGGSIWLNIENKKRFEFTEIDPTVSTINLCGTNNTGEYGEIIEPATILDTPTVFFPNVFTPNGDTKNDIFRAICYDKLNIEQFDLKIFNRFGTMVFHTYNLDAGWNGANTELSTFYYYCRYRQRNKKPIETKGDVIVLK